jgi:hypothetical protein
MAETDKDAQIKGLTELVKALNHKLSAQSAVAATVSPGFQKKYTEFQIASLEQQIAYTKQSVATYQWELFASSVMMWITVLVVIAGVGFSGFQLWHAARLGQNTDGTWEVSMTGMKVTSSVVGIIVLAMSIAFVFLFLDRVYPIQR